MSLGISGAFLLAVAPLTGSSAAGATVRTMVVDPSSIPGCDVDPAGPCEEPTPVVTVTVTEDPGGGTSETPVPQQTVTTTVTVPPTTKPPKTTAPPPPPETTAPPAQESTAPIAPPETEATPPASEESEVQFPVSTPSATLPSAGPSPGETGTIDEGASNSSVAEIRNAGSEFDGATLSRQLGIPALILVLLVLFAVLIFEGRLRRLAHAAAIRRAGPRGMAPRVDSMDPLAYHGGPGYAAGPGFVPGPYQSGTAYAPIISLVPMQMYSPVYPEGYVPGQYPYGYEQTTAYMPAPGYEQQVTGHGDPYGQQAPQGQAPYGPVDQGGPAAFHDTPPFGQGPQGDRSRSDHPQGDFQPFGPESQGAPGQNAPGQGGPGQDAPEQGGSGDRTQPGWQENPGALGPEPREGRFPQGNAEFSGAPFPKEPGRGGSGAHGGPFGGVPGGPDGLGGDPATLIGPGGSGAYGGSGGPGAHGGSGAYGGPGGPGGPGAYGGPGSRPDAGEQPPTEPASTAVYPLPGQEVGKKKRGLFRRSS
ncbi:hypothetical protein OIE13_35675 [Streptosporangium sp. NBC_01810]|uniref:hypothetical protein n=1 Tax=Streptosporangium sp. NBC_01810 TaxID=2975951 RepID=UPI002DDC529D|nr:hypothetical protein [Streptosporangium sp. NBC_01810]WSA26168.1 hypothetical protein OIE13_35675 [Streptosporangium sp. NBC_01810]